MVDWKKLDKIDPYVRMMRLKKAAALTGKWRDFDNVYTYIAAGSGDFIVDGIRYSLHTGNAIIIPPYKTHLIISNGDEPLVQYIMHFDYFEKPERIHLENKDVLDEEEEKIKISEEELLLGESVTIAEIPEGERNDIRKIYLSLKREFEDKKRGRGIMLKSGCISLLVNTLRCFKTPQESQVDKDAKKTKSWIHIENTIEYLHTVTVIPDNETIAAEIGVSPNYLTRVFQEYLGMSLHKYILNITIEKAQQILLSGNANITETAERCGFSSIHVFSKTFKNMVGISPSEFLNQNVSREQLRENLYELATDSSEKTAILDSEIKDITE